MIGFDRVLRIGDDDEWLAVSACVVKLCFCDCFSVMRLCCLCWCSEPETESGFYESGRSLCSILLFFLWLFVPLFMCCAGLCCANFRSFALCVQVSFYSEQILIRVDEMERGSLWFGLGLTFGYGQKQTKKKIKLKRIIKNKVFQSLIKKDNEDFCKQD